MKSDKFLMGIVIALVISIVVFASTVFTVNEWERGLKFQFGEFSGEELQPGINFKMPLVNTIQTYDVRIQTMDRSPERFITVNKEELLVDSFVKWRIKDLQTYFKSVKTRANAENRLEQKINNSLKAQIAKRSIADVVAGDRIEIMNVVQAAIVEEAVSIGVEVVDVRLKRVDYANEIRDSVFRDMESERNVLVQQKESTGEKIAEEIRAKAEAKRLVMVANAERDSNILRGEGDALATSIYAQAYGKDPEFYGMYRSLNAYKSTFSGKNDVLLIKPDSDFFKYFNSPEGN